MTTVAYPQVDDRAPCRSGDPERYFPTTGNDMSDLGKVCRGCPFIDPCLAYALHHDVDGVWGGTSAAQRKRIRASVGITPVTLRFRYSYCGTVGGYHRHRRAEERPCGACTEANTAYNKARRAS